MQIDSVILIVLIATMFRLKTSKLTFPKVPFGSNELRLSTGIVAYKAGA